MAVQFTVMAIDDDQVAPPRKTVFDKNEISIGRSRLNDLVLDHPGVSNTHARVRVEANDGQARFFISDLDSTNGTMVGNRRLDPRIETAIPEKDRILIAGYIVKVENISDELVPQTEKIGKITNGHAKRSPTVHVAFDGKGTDSYVRPEEPEVKEMIAPLPEPPLGVEETVGTGSFDALPAVEELPEFMPSHESSESIPSFEAEAMLRVEDGDIEIDFVATALLKLTGVVLHRGNPLEGVRVTDPSLGEKVTDAAGRFEYGEILEGTPYSLSFSKPGFLLTPDTIGGTLIDRDESVEVFGKKLFSISGKITHRGVPLNGVRVDGGKLGVVLTDADGQYRFENVPEGEEHTLKASKNGFSFGTVRKVT